MSQQLEMQIRDVVEQFLSVEGQTTSRAGSVRMRVDSQMTEIANGQKQAALEILERLEGENLIDAKAKSWLASCLPPEEGSPINADETL